MTVIVRFAPSPTGYLQVGNGRPAVLNALFARKVGGRFLLRIDDTDDERSKPEYETAIVEDMLWLGLHHDLFARQSDRIALYREAADRLRAAGRLYACYETAAELDRKRKRQMALGKPPIYDRAALDLTADDRARLEAQGRKPHWRFLLPDQKVSWLDLIRGRVEIDVATLSDPVLIREDGRFLYTLPSVVDDIDFAISHIIRGEDHVTNTAPQIALFEALGAKPPEFAHFPLFVTVGGEKLSKRSGSLSLRSMREEGVEPLALATYIAKMGTSDAIEPKRSFDVLVEEFDLKKIGRAPARFDPAELQALNAKLLHLLDYDAVADRLAQIGVEGGSLFWNAVRSNLATFTDAKPYWGMVDGPVTPLIEDAPLVAKAAELLPSEPWDEETWGQWTKAVSGETGTKGRGLYHPLRLALTGADHGPEMKKLLPLIGRAKALSRLKGTAA